LGVEELNVLRQILEKVSEIAERGALRTNRVRSAEVDLSEPRSDEPLGLEVPGRVYRWMAVERCDGALTYRFKQTDGSLSDPFRAFRGAGITQHDFLDLVVSNPAGAGICRFIVGYRED